MNNFQNNLVLLGLSGSGKDTVSNHLEYNFNYFPIRLAGTIKQIIREKFNLTEDELETKKRISQKFREEHHKIGEWLNSTDNRIKQIINGTVTEFKYKSEFQNIVVRDCRSIDRELKYFLDADNFTIIYLNRTTSEYKNKEHYTEQLTNDSLLKFISENNLYKKFILIYNDIEPINLSPEQLNVVEQCLGYYNISGSKEKSSLINVVNDCFQKELI